MINLKKLKDHRTYLYGFKMIESTGITIKYANRRYWTSPETLIYFIGTAYLKEKGGYIIYNIKDGYIYEAYISKIIPELNPLAKALYD